MGKKLVVLLNMGGPDSIQSVKPFLVNLFSDNDIFKIPFAQDLFAKLIAELRSKKVETQYFYIGGSSPINKWTKTQSELLQEQLNSVSDEYTIVYAMRYWTPMIRNIASSVDHNNFEKIILLPLYPQYSFSTTLSAFNEWNRFYTGDKEKLVFINNFSNDGNYISALNQKIDLALEKISEKNIQSTVLLFSAHGLPVSFIKRGDPYNKQVIETVENVMRLRNHSHEYFISYQSKVGPVKWLEPSTSETIKKLAAMGKKSVVVIPVSFVSDHIETLYEIKTELGHLAKVFGFSDFVVTEGLNDSPIFINSLFEIIRNTK